MPEEALAMSEDRLAMLEEPTPTRTSWESLGLYRRRDWPMQIQNDLHPMGSDCKGNSR